MNSYSKKYSTPDDPSKFLFLTWETGHTEVKAYFGGRMVTSVDDPSELKKGFYHEDEVVGIVKLKLSNSRLAQLEISVDGTKYQPEASKTDTGGLGNVATVFWILTAFGAAAAFLIQFWAGFDFNNTIMFIELIMDIVI